MRDYTVLDVFTDVPLEEHLAFYRDGIDELAARDPHAGLLVNLHCQGFHNQRFGTMPEAVMKPRREYGGGARL